MWRPLLYVSQAVAWEGRAVYNILDEVLLIWCLLSWILKKLISNTQHLQKIRKWTGLRRSLSPLQIKVILVNLASCTDYCRCTTEISKNVSIYWKPENDVKMDNPVLLYWDCHNEFSDIIKFVYNFTKRNVFVLCVHPSCFAGSQVFTHGQHFKVVQNLQRRIILFSFVT